MPRETIPAAGAGLASRVFGMTNRRRIAWMGLASVAGLVLAAAAGWSQSAPSPMKANPLAQLRVGQWVQVKGTLRSAGPLTCTKLQHLAGDFLDDDWALRGTVSALDTVRRQFRIGACLVQITGTTIFGHPTQKFRGFSDVREGMLIEVEGAYQGNGLMLAAEVDDETAELAGRPRLKDEVVLVGKIQRIDGRKRVLTVMGTDFQLDDKTRVHSALR